MALVLSEDEYRLVSIVLEEASMPPDDLTALAATRLWLEEADTRALLEVLLAREVLALKEGLVVSQVTREEADQTVLDRALNAFLPRWPAPEPPPESEGATTEAPPVGEEPEDKPAFFRRNNPALWVTALLLAAAIGIALWLLARGERYPMLTTFEDGRVFIQQVKPESTAQEAAVGHLMAHARDQRWFNAPVFDTFEITAMEEYAADGSWAVGNSLTQLTSSVYDIAATHKGMVVFVTVEHTVAETVPSAPYDNGTHIYRVYLTGDGDGGWTTLAMESSSQSEFSEVASVELAEGDRTYTVTMYGAALALQEHNTAAVIASDGESRQLLYLTEAPGTQKLGMDTLHDLNDDGYTDLLLTYNNSDSTALCYLYSPEDNAFQLCPELCGVYVRTDPALPGTVQYDSYTSSEDATTIRHFCRVNGDGTLTELASRRSAQLTDKAVYSYYLGGELVQTHELTSLTDESALTPQTVIDQFTPSVCWDELVLRAAQEHGCLDLPQPSYLSSEVFDYTKISLIHWDYENNVAFYTSPSQLLLLRDGNDLQVFPVDTRTIYFNDLDGDGDYDLQGATTWIAYPVMLWNGAEEWTLEVFDLTAIVTDFNSSTICTWAENSVTLNYNGQYGSDSVSSILSSDMITAIEAGQNIEAFTPAIPISAPSMTAFDGSTGYITYTFPVWFLRPQSEVYYSFLEYAVTVCVPETGSLEVVSCSLENIYSDSRR